MNYKGGIDYIFWLVNRISGIIIFLFLIIHILMLNFLKKNAENTKLFLLKNSLFIKFSEFILVSITLMHILTGLRILFLEFELTTPKRTPLTKFLLFFYVLLIFIFFHKMFLKT